MCRNIKPLFNYQPPATDAEVQQAALQYVRKISGFASPSKVNQAAFQAAVEQISAASRQLIDNLQTTAAPRDRQAEEERARLRSLKRFGESS